MFLVILQYTVVTSAKRSNNTEEADLMKTNTFISDFLVILKTFGHGYTS